MINFELFIIASLVIIVAPGNDMIYVITQSIHQGKSGGVMACLGVGLGSIVHTVMAAFGISTLLIKFPEMFLVIKGIGALYLIFLGGKMLLQGKTENQLTPSAPINPTNSKYNILRQGLFINLLNPKVAIFFLAFLPQFVDLNSNNFALNILILGLIFEIMGTAFNLTIVAIVERFRNFLAHNNGFQKWQTKITGTILIILGIIVFMQKLK